MTSAAVLSHQEKLWRIPLFSGLPATLIDDLAGQLRLERYRNGAVVFTEGSPGDSLCFIESGQVRVAIGSGRDERIINYLGPGNFFGEMAVLLNQRRTATVTVVIDADLWVLRKSDLNALLDRFPAAAIQIIEQLPRRLTDSIRRPLRPNTWKRVAVLGDEPWELAGALMELTGDCVALLDLSGAELAQHVTYLPVSLPVMSLSPRASAQTVVEQTGRLAAERDRMLVALPHRRCQGGAAVRDRCLDRTAAQRLGQKLLAAAKTGTLPRSAKASSARRGAWLVRRRRATMRASVAAPTSADSRCWSESASRVMCWPASALAPCSGQRWTMRRRVAAACAAAVVWTW